MAELDTDKAVELLNRILEQELAGVVRYTHYSLLVFGYNRIPIVAWLREQAERLREVPRGDVDPRPAPLERPDHRAHDEHVRGVGQVNPDPHPARRRRLPPCA